MFSTTRNFNIQTVYTYINNYYMLMTLHSLVYQKRVCGVKFYDNWTKLVATIVLWDTYYVYVKYAASLI